MGYCSRSPYLGHHASAPHVRTLRVLFRAPCMKYYAQGAQVLSRTVCILNGISFLWFLRHNIVEKRLFLLLTEPFLSSFGVFIQSSC